MKTRVAPLTLDLATNTGWAFGMPKAKPLSGCFTVPGADLGRFGLAFLGWFRSKLSALQPSEVVFEAPILPPPKWRNGRVVQETNLGTLRRLYSLPTLVEMACAAEDPAVPCSEIGASEWRKPFLGQWYPRSGERDDFKAAAMKVCGLHGWHPATDDEAEALGILHVVLCARDPRFGALSSPGGLFR